MLEDDQGRLWISSTKGLSRFDPSSRTFRNYDVRDGLQSNEFNGGAAFRCASGEMLFGGIRGFNLFFPGEIGFNAVPPTVVVTGLRLYNRPVTAGEVVDGRVVLERAMAFTRALELSHRDAVFSFELAALHYSAPEKNHYSYCMEGLSDTWIPVDAGLRLATFSGLPAGRYVLRVRGANSDGVWSPQSAVVRVTVTPPFWGTWWFRLAALAVVAALAWIGARERMSRVRMRTELAAAHRAQMAIMPQDAPKVDGFDVAAVCIPAHEVGGDFYDYFWLRGPPRRLCLAVGDVAGKAMPAAMNAVMSDGMVFSLARQGGAVSEVMTCLNRTMHHKVSRRMFTAFCLLSLEPSSGDLSFANAGLCEPLYRSGASAEYLSSPGPRFPLGAFLDTRYEQRVQRLAPGEAVVVFTDGVPEARNQAGELYGYEALRGLVAGLDPASHSAASMVDAIVADVRRFAGTSRQSDDLALLVIVAHRRDRLGT
jgi:serine phosphatase RsbU (regulator of sigma subunit)